MIMKRINKIVFTTFASLSMLCGVTSCEKFLDQSPSMGVDESEVYSDYTSVSLFLDGAYRWLQNELEYNSLCPSAQLTFNGAISDECASIFNGSGLGTINSGNWSATHINTYEIGDGGNASLAGDRATAIFRAYRTIRICNAVIENYTLVDMTQDEEDKLLGQAYFLRAWSYFQLIRRYGGMPDLRNLYETISEYNQPRLTYHESHNILIEDLELAIAKLPTKWDEGNVGRANKLAAMAVKANAMLYDASPLMQNGLDSTVDMDYDKSRALAAAQYTQVVIDYVKNNKALAKLSSNEDYQNIFYWLENSKFKPEEALWYNRDTADDVASSMRVKFLPHDWATTGSAGGNWVYSYYAPTQNMVDMFERCVVTTDTNGEEIRTYYPISDPRSGYTVKNGVTNDMYTNRDPRLQINILLPGQVRGRNANTGLPLENTFYYFNDGMSIVGGSMVNDASNQYINTRMQSGYMINKFVWENCNNHGDYEAGGSMCWKTHRAITTYLRVAHLYLNYAEAAYEATGNYNQAPDGCTLTPLQALNIIRVRGGISEWAGESAYDSFREAYRRERCIEFMFENCRWYDLRRWMIAEKVFSSTYPIKGVYAVRSGYNSADAGSSGGEFQNVPYFDNDPIEDGTFSCSTVDLTCEMRGFSKRNYWYPFSTYDVNALSNLKQNPGW